MGTVDFNHLAVFVAVAESGSFTEAAKRLRVPKSTVSRAVVALEAEIGLGLLHRTTRSVSLTTAGAELFARTASRIGSLRDAVADLPELDQEPSGGLRITATADFAAEVLAGVVTEFCRRYPRMTVDVHLSTRVVDIVKEGFDAAFRIAHSLPDSTLVARRIGEVQLQLFASPAYIAARGAPARPEGLGDHPYLAFGRFSTLPLVGPDAVEVQLRAAIVADDGFFVRAALRQGAGIGVLPMFLAESDLRSGALVRVLPQWSMPDGTIWFITPGGRHPPRKLALFRDCVAEALRSYGEG